MFQTPVKHRLEPLAKIQKQVRWTLRRDCGILSGVVNVSGSSVPLSIRRFPNRTLRFWIGSCISLLWIVAVPMSSVSSAGSYGLLTTTTAGLGTQFAGLDMTSPQNGYGVVFSAALSSKRPVLVETKDSARTWSVVSTLPGSLEPQYGVYIKFLTQEIGYLAPLQEGEYPTGDHDVYLTRDGGKHWTTVLAPGVDWKSTVSGGSLWITSSKCASPRPYPNPATCPTMLSRFAIAETTPNATVSVPSTPSTIWQDKSALGVVRGPRGPEVVLGAPAHGSPILNAFVVNSSKWVTVSNPCPNMSEGATYQLLSSGPHKWLFYCFQDGGMNQGTSELWSSSTSGHSWSRLSYAGMMGYSRGNIGDVSATIHLSADRSILWATLLGAAGGLEYSLDGGRLWTSVPLPTNYYGGAQEFLSPAGPHGALFGVVSGPLWRSEGGTRFSLSPTLKVGDYRGVSPCGPRSTRVTLGPRETQPSNSYQPDHSYDIEFTNHGPHSCYFYGNAAVTSLTPASTSGASPAAFPSGNGTPHLVVIHPGQQASIFLVVERVAHYGTSYCHPAVVHRLVVAFGPNQRFTVATPAFNACSAFSSLVASVVVKGILHGMPV